MRTGTVGLVFLIAASGSGGIEHTMLHGVTVARVRAHASAEGVPGLTDVSLKAAVESRLSQGGVQVKSNAGADLFVGATAVLGPSGDCVVYVDGRLVEEAKLERNGLRVDATSWSQSAIVVGNRDNCGGFANKAAQQVVDDFVEHYRAMNPTGSAK
jgi:hypothetical protein